MSDNTKDEDDHPDETDVHRRTFDPARDSVVRELIEALAAATETDPTELAVLAEFVDPEALDGLFRSRPGGVTRDAEVHVEFIYEGYLVRIDGSGVITLRRNGDRGAL
ncbi:HalOD1 output domain-containing protein [Haloferacaceae archaeon DSL9]